jgi:hypothetical protein
MSDFIAGLVLGMGVWLTVGEAILRALASHERRHDLR